MFGNLLGSGLLFSLQLFGVAVTCFLKTQLLTNKNILCTLKNSSGTPSKEVFAIIGHDIIRVNSYPYK